MRRFLFSGKKEFRLLFPHKIFAVTKVLLVAGMDFVTNIIIIVVIIIIIIIVTIITKNNIILEQSLLWITENVELAGVFWDGISSGNTGLWY